MVFVGLTQPTHNRDTHSFVTTSYRSVSLQHALIHWLHASLQRDTPSTRYNRLSNQLYNRFDDRLYRVNGA